MKTEQKQAKWRNSFFILLGFNLIIIVVILYGLLSPTPKPETIQDVIPSETNNATFVVHTTAEDVSEFINAYIKDLLAEEAYQYSVVLQKDVQIRGELPFFGSTFPLLIILEPHVLADGNLLLKQKSLSLGKLNLPNKQAMKYVANLLEIPDWVVINPSREEIVVHVTEIKTKSNLQLAIEQFDLRANEITIKIGIPFHSNEG